MQEVPPRLGQRRCLLKGCERSFHPRHPLSRYCGAECAQAARRWQQRTANQRYRASSQGRERRREQARRYRVAAQARKAASICLQEPGVDGCADGCPQPERPLEGCEGYPYVPAGENSCCRRPGCYESFPLTGRSPRQKFCSWACRQALRRVVIRERRWRRQLARHGLPRCQRDDFW